MILDGHSIQFSLFCIAHSHKLQIRLRALKSEHMDIPLPGPQIRKNSQTLSWGKKCMLTTYNMRVILVKLQIDRMAGGRTPLADT